MLRMLRRGLRWPGRGLRLLSGAPKGSYKLMPMPPFAPSVQEARIAKWHLQEGDTVETYDLAFDAEVEELSPDIPGAVTLEVEVQEEGFLAKILVKEGQSPTPVNHPVAVLCEEEADVEFFRSPAGEKLLEAPPKDLRSETTPFLWQAYMKK